MINQFNNWLDDNAGWKIIITLSIVLISMAIVAMFGQHKFVTMSIVIILCTLNILRFKHPQ